MGQDVGGVRVGRGLTCPEVRTVTGHVVGRWITRWGPRTFDVFSVIRNTGIVFISLALISLAST